ncbi:MAG: Pvc16 family protein [Streptosporangiaceae bacterium]
MLRDLDLSVAAFLRGLLPSGTAIQFGAPDPSWAQATAQAPVTGPLLDAFLYDVREAQPPASDGTMARDSGGRATGWQPPVRRYRVSYLLTAWPDTSEHELLGAILVGSATQAAIPPECLTGILAGTGETVPLTLAAADRAADATRLWGGLGVKARAALDLMVIAPVVPPLLTELAPAPRAVEVGVARKPPPPPPDTRPEGWERRHITEG